MSSIELGSKRLDGEDGVGGQGEVLPRMISETFVSLSCSRYLGMPDYSKLFPLPKSSLLYVAEVTQLIEALPTECDQ